MKKLWPYYDYCHYPYTPVKDPQGGFPSCALFENSLQQCRYRGDFLAILERIREAIGPWNTVWGVKLERGKLAWELYFYNRDFKDWDRVVLKLLKALKAYFSIPEGVENGIKYQPYFMFSIDLDEGIFSSKRINGFHLYREGNPGVFQGYSYYWGPEGIHFENSYDFFEIPRETGQFVHAVKQSLVLGKDWKAFVKQDAVKRLMPCHRICVAHKKGHDGIYFSRVNAGQLLYFLEFFSYPAYIVDYVRGHQDKFDHLLYDVAFDCPHGQNGLTFGKSSYYSVF